MNRWMCKSCKFKYDGYASPDICPNCGKQMGFAQISTEEEQGFSEEQLARCKEISRELLFECFGANLSVIDGVIEAIPESVYEFEAPTKFVTQSQFASISAQPADQGQAQATTYNSVQEEVPEYQGDIRPWNDWKDIPVGHKQAMVAMETMLLYTNMFKEELKAARREWNTSRHQNQEEFNSISQSAREVFERDRNKFQNECNTNINNLSGRKERLNSLYQACNIFVEGLSGNPKSSAKRAFEKVSQKKFAIGGAIHETEKAYQKLLECQIADIERIRDGKVDAARNDQLEKDRQAEHRFNVKYSGVKENRRNDIAMGFNKSTLRAYSQELISSKFNVDNYECPKEVPPYVVLGTISAEIPNKDQDDNIVVQALDLQTSDYATKGKNQYTITLPYAQRLIDGISILMRYTPADREYVQGMIQPLLLKLFMSFPAGKLEATMIDPLELGASFPDIPKLGEGPKSARVIDTKIWSKEKEIEVAISTLRQRLENMTQAYGGDQESRLKKEVIRALAITDFPVGFSEQALKDLHAIVRNSASLGVCVLICANVAELEKLKDRNGNLVAEIAQSVVEINAEGDKFILSSDANSKLFIQIDDMHEVIAQKNEILPYMSEAIEHSVRRVEKFEDMYPFDIYDSNNWFTGNHSEIAIPLGIKGADTVVKMILGRGGGSTEHHALIAGQTGAGKSTLLHTLIMSTLISYSPEEVQMYLLDFKEGVEFSPYTRYRLPSLRVVAINSEREFGLSVLKELCSELEIRSKHFTRYGVSDINGYFELTDVPKVPKLLLIFDEVQELFRKSGDGDTITSECLSCLNKIVMQGRAMGVHVILACQDFHNCSGLEAYFSQMAIRIAVKGSEEGAASILNSDNKGIRTLQGQPAGGAIYNGGGGVESANNPFQVSYTGEDVRMKLWTKLDEYYSNPQIAPIYQDQQTRILLTNAEDNIHNPFNQLILYGSDTIEQMGKSKDGYGLLLGQGFGKKSIFVPEMRMADKDNLLIVTKEEKMGLSLFELSAMSVLYEELHTKADKANNLVYIIDLFADELSDDECDFDYLMEQFPQQVCVEKIGRAEDVITTLYDLVMNRLDGKVPCTERIFFMFFGINRARKLRDSGMYDNESGNEISAMEKIKRILIKGPKVGVNSIIWGESLRGIENMLGDRCDALFDKRIAFGLDAESMDLLVAENDSKTMYGKTAVYMDVGKDIKNTHFRPYEVPARVWIERYGEVYDRVINEGGV